MSSTPSVNLRQLLKNARHSGPYGRQNILLLEHIPAKNRKIGGKIPILLKNVFLAKIGGCCILLICIYSYLCLLASLPISRGVMKSTPLDRTFQVDSETHVVF